MKKNERHKKNKRISFALVITLIVTTFVGETYADARISAAAFPDKTLIIGTHAIYLDMMNGTIIDIALATADDTGQGNIYYKSDINAGTWYDITDSSDIMQITLTGSNIVTNTVINELPLTHYTDATGKTIEFDNGQKVYLCDIPDYMYPVNMPELEGVIMQQDIQQGLTDSSKKDVYEDNLRSIKRILATIEIDEAEDLKDQMHGMEDNMVALQAAGTLSIEQSNLLHDTLADLISQRNTILYNEMIIRLETQSKALDYSESGGVIDAYNTAITEIQGVLAETSDSTSEETAYSAMIEAANAQVLSAVESGDANALQSAAEQLENIKNAQYGQVEPGDMGGIAALQGAKSAATSLVNEKSSDAYYQEKMNELEEDGSSAATVEQVKNDIADEILYAVNGLVDIDLALAEVLPSPVEQYSALQSTKNLLDGLSLVNDGLQAKKDLIVEQMQEVRLSQDAEYLQLQEEVALLDETLEDLYEEYMDALEKNNLDLATEIKSEVDQLAGENATKTDALEEREEGIKDGTIPVAIKDVSLATMVEEGMADDPAEAALNNVEEIADAVVPLDSNALSTVNQGVAADQKEQFSESEVDALMSTVEANENYLYPWYVLFPEKDAALQSPVMVLEGELYVPAREMAAVLEAQVMTNQGYGTEVIRKQGALIEYTSGEEIVYVNDKKTYVKPTPQRLYGGQIYLPLYVFEKAFNFTHYEEGNYIVITGIL
ncbi:MAG: stalk domain-containing protein [Bacillota bacterium]